MSDTIYTVINENMIPEIEVSTEGEVIEFLEETELYDETPPERFVVTIDHNVFGTWKSVGVVDGDDFMNQVQ